MRKVYAVKRLSSEMILGKNTDKHKKQLLLRLLFVFRMEILKTPCVKELME